MHKINEKNLLKCTKLQYIVANLHIQWQYIEEEKRGFYPEENHTVSGVFEIEIPKKAEKEISFVCSFEENIDQINVSFLCSI